MTKVKCPKTRMDMLSSLDKNKPRWSTSVNVLNVNVVNVNVQVNVRRCLRSRARSNRSKIVVDIVQ